MKVITNKKILFLIGIITYWAFFFAKRSGFVAHPIIQGYLSDFLAIPLMLGVILIILRWYSNDPRFQISSLRILFAFVYISVAFEWILPKYKANFHADWWDVLAYGLGALVFGVVQSAGWINRVGTKKPQPIA